MSDDTTRGRAKRRLEHLKKFVLHGGNAAETREAVELLLDETDRLDAEVAALRVRAEKAEADLATAREALAKSEAGAAASRQSTERLRTLLMRCGHSEDCGASYREEDADPESLDDDGNTRECECVLDELVALAEAAVASDAGRPLLDAARLAEKAMAPVREYLDADASTALTRGSPADAHAPAVLEQMVSEALAALHAAGIGNETGEHA